MLKQQHTNMTHPWYHHHWRCYYCNTQILELGISDHQVVLEDGVFPPPASRTKRSITFHRIKDIDFDMLSSVSHWKSKFITTTTLQTGLDWFVPLKMRQVSFCHSVPWFTAQLRALKSEGRKIERRLRQTGLTVHQLAHHQHQTAYSSPLRAARASYYSTLIESGHSNPNLLFSPLMNVTISWTFSKPSRNYKA